MAEEEITLPDPVPYSHFFKFEDRPEFRNMFVYVLRYFPEADGFQLVINRSSGILTVRVADFLGNLLDPTKTISLTKHISEFTEKYLTRLTDIMKLVGIRQAIFYISISDIARLVDMRLSLNKMCGPGYLQDFFGKAGMPVQEIVGKPILLNDENLKKIQSGVEYPDNKYIIKPSVFKSIIQGNDLIPLYGVISREIKTFK